MQSVQDGRDIVDHYKNHGTLTKSDRDLLVRMIISKLMAVKDGVLKNSDFESSAKVIVNLFERETVVSLFACSFFFKGKNKFLTFSMFFNF